MVSGPGPQGIRRHERGRRWVGAGGASATARIDGGASIAEVAGPQTLRTNLTTPADQMTEIAPDFLSCGMQHLYREDTFPEGLERYEELSRKRTAAEFISKLYPSYRYRRPVDLDDLHCGSTFASLLEGNRRATNGGKAGAAAALFRFERAIVRDRVIHVPNGEGWSVVYETFRPCDRHNSEVATEEQLANAVPGAEGDEPIFFLGSTGCFNYGHWLSDDLSRLSAFWKIRDRHPDGHIRVVITAHGGVIDEVRKQSIEFLLGSDRKFSVGLFPRPSACEFRDLYYASPTTYPGTLKSPLAMADLHIAGLAALAEQTPAAAVDYALADARRGRRLFINRDPSRSRGLLNGAEIFAALQPLGFEHHTMENATFAEQVSLFSGAGIVVGNMGAGMVNTVFCRPGTPMLYLAPEGWDDGFYWDLATVMRHRHAAFYGPPASADFNAGYTADPEAVRALTERMLGGAELR